jgi:hypothetical protein
LAHEGEMLRRDPVWEVLITAYEQGEFDDTLARLALTAAH